MSDIDPLTDLMVRTVYGEGDGQPAAGQQAITATALNRAKATGQSLHDVLLAPGQYQAWQNPTLRQRMTSLSQDDPAYQQILANISPTLAGGQTTVGGATNYLNRASTPAGSTALSSWAAKPGTKIGAHEFYNADGSPAAQSAPSGPSDAQIDTLVGGKPVGGAAAAPAVAQPAAMADKDVDALVRGAPDPGVTDAATGLPLQNAAQVQAARDAQGRRELDLDNPNIVAGDSRKPFYEPANHDLSTVPQGAFYIDTAGHTQIKDPISNPLMYSVAHGLEVPANSLMKAAGALTPFSDNPAAIADITGINSAAASANQRFNKFDSTGEGAVGNVVGQIASTIPLAMGGEEALGALGSAGEFLAGKGGGNLLMRGASKITGGALQGAGTAAALSSASDQPLASQIGSGALTGGLMGAAAPLVEGAAGGVRNAFFPTPVSENVANLAKLASEKYGISLRGSQIAGAGGDRGAAITDSELLSHPESGYPANNAAQRTAFTKAVAGTFGSDADELTPQAMQAAKTDIGSRMNDIGARNTLKATPEFQLGAHQILQDASMNLTDSELAPLQKQWENIQSKIDPATGTMDGATYQALTRTGSPLDRATENPNSNIRYYAQQLKGILDDAMQASMPPEDAAAFSKAKLQYKNLMTVKNLATKAGVEGTISPALLNGAVNQSFKNRAFSGAGDLGELSQIGQAFMKEAPNSGTAPRLRNMLTSLAGGAGVADLALAVHDPVLATKLALTGGALAGGRYAANAASGALNDNPLYRNALLRGANGGQGPNLMQQLAAMPLIRSGIGAAQDSLIPTGVVARNQLLAPPQQPNP